MDQALWRQAEQQLRWRKKQNRLRLLVGLLACLAAFCAVCTQIVPALTLEGSAVLDCPLEVHSHSPDCYDGETLVCGKADFVVHTHDENCYAPDGSLACTLPEVTEHLHTEDCYEIDRYLVCGQEETGPEDELEPAEQDTEALEDGEDETAPDEEQQEPDEPAQAGHVHSDACYETEQVLTCGQEEVVLHTHTEACYGEDGALSCGRMEATSHQHGEACRRSVPTATPTPEATETDDQASPQPQAPPEESPVPTEEVPPAAVSLEDGVLELTDVVVQQREHSWTDGWTTVTNDRVYLGYQLRFLLYYQVPAGAGTYTCQVPEEITSFTVSGGSLFNDAGEVIGSYRATGQTVELTFTAGNTTAHSGYVAVETTVDDVMGAKSGQLLIPFREGFSLELWAIHPGTDDLHVVQQAAEVDELKGWVHYVVSIGSDDGTQDSVRLEAVLTNLTLSGDVTVLTSGVTASVTQTDSGFIATLPRLKAGGKYELSYTALFGADTLGDKEGVSQVTVSAAGLSGENLWDSDTSTISFSGTYAAISGVLVGEDAIDWTIQVNEGRRDIGGLILQDLINGEIYTGTAVLTDSKGNSSTIYLPYTFPAGTTDSYTITYRTGSDKLLGQWGTVNWVVLFTGNWQWLMNIQGEVGDGQRFLPLTLTAEPVQPISGTEELAHVPWSLTVDADQGPIPAEWTLRIELEDGQWLTESQMTAFKAELDEALAQAGLGDMQYSLGANLYEADGSTGAWVSQLQGAGSRYKVLSVTFRSALPRGKSLTLDFSATTSLGNGEDQVTVRTTAKVNGQAETAVTATAAYHPLLRVYDGVANTGEDTYHSYTDAALAGRGVLTWCLKVKPPAGYQGGALTLTDTLPDGVELTGLTLVGEGLSADTLDLTRGGTGQLGPYAVTAAISGQTVTLTLPEELVADSSLQELQFTVKAGIRADYPWGEAQTASFQNAGRVSSADGAYWDTGEQTQIISRSVSSKAISKSVDQLGNNVVAYTLLVNPQGEDLAEGADTITVVDQLQKTGSSQLDYVPFSMKVYEMDPAGGKGDQVWDFSYVVEDRPLSGSDYFYDVIDMTLPDEIPLVVEYSYRLTGNAGAWARLTNSATIQEYTGADRTAWADTSVYITQDGSGSVSAGLRFYAVSSRNYGEGAQGAVFQLYRYDAEQNAYVAEGQYESGVNGLVRLEGLAPNTAYRLEEITRPPGFSLYTDGYEFSVGSPTAAPSGFSGTILNNGDIVYLPHQATSTALRVDKRWLDAEGQDITDSQTGEVFFDLYQVTSDTPPENGMTLTVTINVTCYGKQWWTEELSVPLGSSLTLGLTNLYGSYLTEEEDFYLRVNDASQTTSSVVADGEYHRTFVYRIDNVTRDMTITGNLQSSSLGYWSHDLTVNAPTGNGTVLRVIRLGTSALSAKQGWTWTSDSLPLMAEENGQVVYYSYYVREHQNASYRTEYENNDTEHGIGSGTITIINQQVNTYQLPSAGGLGPWPYWGGGLALMGGAIYCFVLQGRREAPSPDARSEIARPYSKKRKRKQWNT